MSRQLLLVSSSRCHPFGYLDHCESEMLRLFKGAAELIFVPYARPGGSTHDAYTKLASERFEAMGLKLRGLHEYENPAEAVRSTDGVFIGGGNTFVLLAELYRTGVLPVLRERVLEGMPYMGTSAGSNVAGLTIGTSNDMPIRFPPSFDAMGAVPFNLNPHFPAQAPDPTHKGETREDRLGEFHIFNQQPVVAIHEDGMLKVDGDRIELIGNRPAFVFHADKATETVQPGEFPMPDAIPKPE